MYDQQMFKRNLKILRKFPRKISFSNQTFPPQVLLWHQTYYQSLNNHKTIDKHLKRARPTNYSFD